MQSLLLSLFIVLAKSQELCGHDQDDLPIPTKTQYEWIDHPQGRRLNINRGSNYQPIRVHFHKLDLLLTPYQEERLTKYVLVAAQKALFNALRVKPVIGNLVLPSTSSSCGDATIPNEHKTIGVEADLIIYVMGRYEPSAGYAAKAGACYLDPGDQNMPIAGQMIINTSAYTDPESLTSFAIILHETTHILGFSSGLYQYFQYLNASGNYVQYGVTNVRGTAVYRGSTYYIIKTPKVVAKMREIYGCSTLQGMPLENQGGSGTAGTHWEKEFLLDDYMCGSLSNFVFYTPITLALLEDTGWYQSNYEFAQNPIWGYKEGCEFFQNACIQNSVAQFDEYCGVAGAKKCGHIGTAGGYCFKYDILAGSCNYVLPYSNRDCTNTTPGATLMLDNFGEQTCPECRCLEYGYAYYLNQSNVSETTGCYKVRCTPTAAYVQTTGSNEIQCPYAGGDVLVNYVEVQNYTRTFHCPKYEQLCGPKPCKEQCRGVGQCVNGQCQCQEGFGGEACEIQCHISCKNCSGEGINQCTSCPGGVAPQQGTCGCAEGQGWDTATQKCGSCPANCSQCTTVDKCDVCKDTFIKTSTNQCTCPTATMLSAGKCQNCIANCQKCTSLTTCDQCKSGYGYKNAQCLSCIVDNCDKCKTGSYSICESCALGYVGNNTNKCTLLQCTDPNCLQCKQTDQSFCEVCKAPKVSTSSGQCVNCEVQFCTKCKSGNPQFCETCENGLAVNGIGQCSSCVVTNCSQCLNGNPNVCQTCETGFEINGGLCVDCIVNNCALCVSGDPQQCQKCADGYGLMADGSCVSCQVENCKQCNGDSTKCNSCTDPLCAVESRLSCVAQCPSGYTKQSGACVAPLDSIMDFVFNSPAAQVYQSRAYTATLQNTKPKLNQGQYFQKSNASLISVTPGLLFAYQYAIQLWVRPSGAGTFLCFKANDQNSQKCAFKVGLSDTFKLRMEILADYNGQKAYYTQYVTWWGLQMSDWNYVGIQFVGNQLKTQINSSYGTVNINSTMNIYGTLDTLEKILIGAYAESTGTVVPDFDGFIASFQFFNGLYALNAYQSDRCLYGNYCLTSCEFSQYGPSCSSCLSTCNGCYTGNTCANFSDQLCASVENGQCQECIYFAELTSSGCQCVAAASYNYTQKTCECLLDIVDNQCKCPDGKGPNSQKTACVDCIANCRVCDNQTSCEECNTGYKVKNGVCSSCVVDNCGVCESGNPDKCISCNSGYQLISGTCSLVECNVSNCSSCSPSNPNQCQVCNTGYAITSSYECSQCLVSNCDRCITDKPNLCMTCHLGYDLTLNGSCQLIPCNVTGCQICDADDPLKCDTCLPGLALTQLLKCSVCVVDNCLTCSLLSPYVCVESAPGFSLLADGKTEPIPCSVSNCKYCNEISQNQCEECLHGYALTQDMTCSDCIVSNCTQCQQEQPDTCKTCKIGYALSATNTCSKIPCQVQYCSQCSKLNVDICEICASGYSVDTNGQCEDCIVDNCDICEDNNPQVCSQCAIGFALNAGQCSQIACQVENCAQCEVNNEFICKKCANNYALTDELKCSQCVVDNCTKCKVSDPQVCEQCTSGYSLGTQGCEEITCFAANCAQCQQLDTNECEICSPGFIKDSNGDCVDCIVQNCSKCASTNPNQCQTCKQGYKLNSIGTCEEIICQVGNCDRCVLGKQDECEKCATGYEVTSDKKCSTCVVSNCSKCIAGDPNSCETCATGYQGNLTTSCVAIPCSVDNCAQCELASSNNCVICKEGFTVDDNKKCESCMVNGCSQCQSFTGKFFESAQVTAVFDSTFRKVVLTFQTAVYNEILQTCADIFQSSTIARFGTNPQCSWNGYTQLYIVLGSGFLLREEPLVMQSQKVQKRYGDCTTNFQTLNPIAEYSVEIPVPDAVIQAPDTYSIPCSTTNLQISLAQITGDLGSPLEYQWSAQGAISSGGKTQVSNEKSSAIWIDPSNLIEGTVIFQVTMKNIMGQGNQESVSVTITHEKSISVQFELGSVMHIKKSKTTQAKAIADFCSLESITWSWEFVSATNHDNFDSTQLLSQITQPNVLPLIPQYIKAGATYQFKAKAVQGSATGQALLTVIVEYQELVADLDRSDGSWCAYQDLTISAYKSYDKDDPNNVLTYNWTVWNETLNQEVVLAQNTMVNIKVPQSELTAGQNYTITVTVSDTETSRSADAQVTLSMIGDCAAAVLIDSIQSKFNYQEQYSISLTVQTTQTCTYQWSSPSCPDLNIAYNNYPLLVIPKGIFSAGQQCQFRLSIIPQTGTESYSLVQLKANIGPINVQVSLSANSCQLYRPITMRVLQAIDGDGEDLPLYYMYGLEKESIPDFFLSPKKDSPDYTIYCLKGLSKAVFHVCDSQDTCHIESKDLTVITGRELSTVDNLQKFKEQIRNVDNIPASVYTFSTSIDDVGQELFDEMSYQLAWYISVQTDMNIQLANSIAKVYSALFSQTKYVSNDILLQYLKNTLLFFQMYDVKSTGLFYNTLALNFKRFMQDLPEDKLNEALALSGSIGRQTLQSLAPEAVNHINDYKDRWALATRITNKSIQGAKFLIDDWELTFPYVIYNAEFIGVDLMCTKFDFEEDMMVSCEAVMSGEFRDHYDGVFKYQYYSDPLPLQTKGLWTIKFKNMTYLTQKVGEYNGYDCISDHQCLVESFTSDMITIKLTHLETVMIVPVKRTPGHVEHPTETLEPEIEQEVCEACYGPLWTLVGMSGAFVLAFLIALVVTYDKRRKGQMDVPSPVPNQAIQLDSSPASPEEAYNTKRFLSPPNPTNDQNQSQNEPPSPTQETSRPVMIVVPQRRWCFRYVMFIEIITTYNQMKRIMNIVTLYSVLMFEFSLLGLMYLLVGDYNNDEGSYGFIDTIERFGFADFGMVFTTVILTFPISAAVQYLITNLTRPRKYIALGIDILMIVESMVLIIGFTSNFCCMASALWTYGMLYIVICELGVSEMFIALLKLTLDTQLITN